MANPTLARLERALALSVNRARPAAACQPRRQEPRKIPEVQSWPPSVLMDMRGRSTCHADAQAMRDVEALLGKSRATQGKEFGVLLGTAVPVTDFTQRCPACTVSGQRPTCVCGLLAEFQTHGRCPASSIAGSSEDQHLDGSPTCDYLLDASEGVCAPQRPHIRSCPCAHCRAFEY